MPLIRRLCLVLALAGASLLVACHHDRGPAPIYRPTPPVPASILEAMKKLALGAPVGEVQELYEQNAWPVAVKLARIEGCTVNDPVTFVSYDVAEALANRLARDPSRKSALEVFERSTRGHVVACYPDTNTLHVMPTAQTGDVRPPVQRDVAIIGAWR